MTLTDKVPGSGVVISTLVLLVSIWEQEVAGSNPAVPTGTSPPDRVTGTGPTARHRSRSGVGPGGSGAEGQAEAGLDLTGREGLGEQVALGQVALE